MTAAALQHQVSQHPWTQKSHPAPANSPAVVLHSDFEKVQMLFWWGRHLPSQQLLTLPECQTNRDGLPCGTFGWIINTWIHCWSSAATGVEAVAPWSPSAPTQDHFNKKPQLSDATYLLVAHFQEFLLPSLKQWSLRWPSPPLIWICNYAKCVSYCVSASFAGWAHQAVDRWQLVGWPAH